MSVNVCLLIQLPKTKLLGDPPPPPLHRESKYQLILLAIKLTTYHAIAEIKVCAKVYEIRSTVVATRAKCLRTTQNQNRCSFCGPETILSW